MSNTAKVLAFLKVHGKPLLRELQAAQSEVRRVRDVLDPIYTEMFLRMQFKDDSNQTLTDYNKTYLSDDVDQVLEFYETCNIVVQEMFPETAKGKCPILLAEHKVANVKGKIVDRMLLEMGSTEEVYNTDTREEIIEAFIQGVHIV